MEPQLPHGPTQISPPSFIDTCRDDFSTFKKLGITHIGPYLNHGPTQNSSCFFVDTYRDVLTAKKLQVIHTVGSKVPYGQPQSFPPSYISTWRCDLPFSSKSGSSNSITKIHQLVNTQNNQHVFFRPFIFIGHEIFQFFLFLCKYFVSVDTRSIICTNNSVLMTALFPLK